MIENTRDRTKQWRMIAKYHHVLKSFCEFGKETTSTFCSVPVKTSFAEAVGFPSSWSPHLSSSEISDISLALNLFFWHTHPHKKIIKITKSQPWTKWSTWRVTEDDIKARFLHNTMQALSARKERNSSIGEYFLRVVRTLYQCINCFTRAACHRWKSS